jgi:hypothetical protein
MYNVSVSVYFVSQTKSLQHRTAAVGQLVTERTGSLFFSGALLPVEEKEMLAIYDEVCLYKQALPKT